MKKLLISLMAVLFLGSLFALESDPSDVVGYVKYDGFTTATTNLNLMALPLDDATIIDVSTLAAALGGEAEVDQISVWDAPNQQWISSVYFFGAWSPNTLLYVSDIVMISVINNLSFYSAGDLPTPAQYNLITTAGTNLNTIMIPLNEIDIVDVTTLATEMGGETEVDQISEWDYANQQWNSSVYFFGAWSPNFLMTIADPLMVSVVNAFAWPTRSITSNVVKTKVNTTRK